MSLTNHSRREIPMNDFTSRNFYQFASPKSKISLRFSFSRREGKNLNALLETVESQAIWVTSDTTVRCRYRKQSERGYYDRISILNTPVEPQDLLGSERRVREPSFPHTSVITTRLKKLRIHLYQKWNDDKGYQ